MSKSLAFTLDPISRSKGTQSPSSARSDLNDISFFLEDQEMLGI
jgi:hypothetical protein